MPPVSNAERPRNSCRNLCHESGLGAGEKVQPQTCDVDSGDEPQNEVSRGRLNALPRLFLACEQESNLPLPGNHTVRLGHPPSVPALSGLLTAEHPQTSSCVSTRNFANIAAMFTQGNRRSGEPRGFRGVGWGEAWGPMSDNSHSDK